MTIPSYNECFEKSVRKHWNFVALSDYQECDFTYGDVARHIERLHRAFDRLGINAGDKIAICGRNSSRWGIAFWACLTRGIVAVPILHEFHPSQVADIVKHSESKLLFVSHLIWPKLDARAFEGVEIVSLHDFSCLQGSFEMPELEKDITPDDVNYYRDQAEEMAVLNYTSGTTSNSKGVMIPYRAMWSNLDFANEVLGAVVKPGDQVVSILPMAHMYGMAFEFLFEICSGCHITFLTKNASPTVLLKALKEIRPLLVIAVPLIIEKVVRRAVLPKLQTPLMRVLLSIPGISRIVKNKVRDQLSAAFGGNFFEVIMGGAALSNEIEAFLRDIRFPFTVGYGTTECAPILAYRDWHTFVPKSCGQAARNMQLRINSADPQHIDGEILAKGPNVMLGYYKNPEATAATIDADGWYHTGDMGIIDSDGNLFIRGRCKNMLLGANGQNIYPEEIEDKLNAMPLVTESIVIQKNEKLYALIYSDPDAVQAAGVKDLAAFMENNRREVNKLLPSYAQITGVRLYSQEFEKTPKKSIKRFLYLDAEV
ncbi:MAG: AMP-binding protein [Bacteroidaceae bacterium]|nr:AMP-binding protein [Bacteroidaceae bacterium]